MTIMEIVTRLGLLQMGMLQVDKFREDPEMYKNIIAVKRAMQILMSIDLKNEIEESIDYDWYFVFM